jgi:NADPH2:quinone reductase
MKAAFITQTGPPECIQFGELPSPEPAPGQIAIDVQAVAVNPIDTYVRSGMVSFPLPQPYIIGCDAAGTVAAVGDGVDGWHTGDPVWCTNQGLLGRQGTFAERIAVDTAWCYRRSPEVTPSAAAASALVAITAHLGLFRNAASIIPRTNGSVVSSAAGKTILVIGGSGGVGAMVVQLAKIAGATVITTAGSEEKARIAQSLGGDHVIEYKHQIIGDTVQQLAPNGVDLVWETRREPDFELAVSVLRQRGMMILMAGREARPVFPVGPFYVKECQLSGLVMFRASAQEMRVAATEIDQWLASGALRPQIGLTLPLAEAAQAHRIQEANTLHGAGTLAGKIVLTTQCHKNQ